MRLRGHEISIGEWKAAADELIAHGARNFTLSGGDALIKPGADELAMHIARALKSVFPVPASPLSVFTTGIGVDNETMRNLKRANALIVIPVHGIDTFDDHTSSHDSFQETLERINLFTSSGLRVASSVIVTSRNVYELENIVRLSLLAGACRVKLMPFRGAGRGRNDKSLVLGALDIQKLGSVASTYDKCFLGEPGLFTISPNGMARLEEYSRQEAGYWRDWKTF